ncbi:MAG: DNA/RNA nuclease SfsA [Pseudomonadota bacterium]|nr:DNA/RNA nuclease SfsA [Pseudomonadota bacterium]
MRLPPLTRGRILRRYKRFLADVELAGGELVTAHVPNTGSMKSCWEFGAPVELSYSDNPRRKLAWTLERVDMGSGWVGVHTGRTNSVMAEGIASGRIPSLAGYRALRREVSFAPAGYPRGRIDIGLFDGSAADALVEVKNVTLLDGDRLCFPDAVSERARKHLDLLHCAVGQGRRGVILFAVNRPEADRFAPAWSIDPAYSTRLIEVAAAGVEVLAVRVRHTEQGLEVGESLPLDLSAPA